MSLTLVVLVVTVSCRFCRCFNSASMPKACPAIAVVDVLLNAHQQVHQDRADGGGDSRFVSGEISLSVTPDEAAALIHFAQDQAVADVTLAGEMPLSKALRLVYRLCRQCSE